MSAYDALSRTQKVELRINAVCSLAVVAALAFACASAADKALYRTGVTEQPLFGFNALPVETTTPKVN